MSCWSYSNKTFAPINSWGSDFFATPFVFYGCTMSAGWKFSLEWPQPDKSTLLLHRIVMAGEAALEMWVRGLGSIARTVLGLMASKALGVVFEGIVVHLRGLFDRRSMHPQVVAIGASARSDKNDQKCQSEELFFHHILCSIFPSLRVMTVSAMASNS